MTLPDLTIAAGAQAPANSSLWRRELVETIRLALPIALTQLGQIAMMTSDLALIGRLGDVAVAAAALAHIILFGAFVVGMGIVSAVAPLAAQAYGARAPRVVRRALRMGLWSAAIAGVPLTALQFVGEDILQSAGQDAATAALAGDYLDGLAWSLVPAWWFIALRSFMGAVNRPEPALWITLAAIPANAALAFCLINGEFGLPHLGILGAGVATTIVDITMCAAAVWVCYARRPFRKYRILGRFWRADWPLMGEMLRLGAPMAGAHTLEYGLFAGAGLLMGAIGTTALAAHQIALQIAAVMFMIPFGIALAATVRVGHAVGRGDAAGGRRAGFSAILLGAAFMCAMTVVVAGLRDTIPSLFLGNDPASRDTARLASTLLLLGASFFIADGVQSVANGALRGRNDTRVPMLFAVIGFWMVGFPSSYGFGILADLGATGVWIGLSLGLAVYAVLLVWRFHALGWDDVVGTAPASAAT
jgi:multidrug resistance protein, MATE family